MPFIISFAISLAILIAGIAFSCSILKNKKVKARYNSFYILVVSVFASASVLFVPIYLEIFSADKLQIIKTILLSVHNSIRLFIVDGEFNIITDNVSQNIGIYEAYSLLAALLFVTAPLLTFGAVLSFFKNILSYQRLMFNYNSDICVFSELNEQSVVLAKSLYTNNKNRLIVFTDVFEKNEEENYELISFVKSIDAICFKKDISEIKFKKSSAKKSLSFFIIGEDDTENIKQFLKLIEKYKHLSNVSLYLFSKSVESELLISSVDKGNMKVRRINDSQLLIFRNLFDNGEKFFDEAYVVDDKHKVISAAIVGMGSYGIEMMKALSWFGQMDNYRLQINAYDKDCSALSKFCSVCPELMDSDHNGNFDDFEESQYKISIHSGIDALSYDFDKKLSSLSHITYILVALGNDDLNLKVSLKLRRIFEAKGEWPRIQTVMYGAQQRKEFKEISNFKGQMYNIEFIGDIESSYSENVVLHSDVEKAALKRHLKWGKESDFWNYEYNYRSSVASAIHNRMKRHCNISGVNKAPDKRTEEEKLNLRMLEHRRWNAYMRSEGYSYAPVRNDLAKRHNCLVPFSFLSEEDKMKDDD